MLVFLVHLFGLCLIMSVLMLAAVVAYFYLKTPKEPRSVEVLEAKLEHCYEHSLGKMDFLKRWLLLSELIRAQTKAMGSDDYLPGTLAVPGGRVAGPQVVKLLDARECYRRAREKAIASRGSNAWRDDPTVVRCAEEVEAAQAGLPKIAGAPPVEWPAVADQVEAKGLLTWGPRLGTKKD